MIASVICLVLKRWYSQKISIAETEIGLMIYQLDVNDPKDSLSSFKEMIRAKYKGLVKYALHMEVEKLEAEIKLEFKLVRREPLIKKTVERQL
uniref:AsnC_trans_reg domain-containing protein n=1 Tax=Strongyloides venezuelensis TaxID=75913 RepID=A0A0K0FHA5_STRVS